MFARWIATVAALLLACANPQASAHVRAEHLGDLANQAEHSVTALPGELARNPQTAPPARARQADLASGKNAALTHCHVRQKSLSESNRTSGVSVYTWDAEGRLVGAVLGNGPTQKSASYRYDPNGIRRSQLVTEAGGAVTRTEYLVDPNQAYAQVLEEWDASAASGPLPDETLATTYVYGDDLISQTKLALAGPSVTSVYHYDGLGTTRALSAYKVDAAGVPQAEHGEITDRYAYTAFGESDPAGTSGDTSGSSENNYRYTGEQLDPNLGFYYLRARYMDPSQGRFLGMDPYKGSSYDPLSLHKYSYCGGASTVCFDPSGNVGLWELTATMAVGGIVNASIGVVMNAFNPTKESVWGDLAHDAGIGALTAPVGGVIGRVLGRVLQGMARPIFARLGAASRITMVGANSWEKAVIRMSRVMFNTNVTYASVQSTFIGRALITLFPRASWQQHHIFIQQAWFRGATPVFNQVLANRGLARLGNAGWNLMPLPRVVNNWLGRSPVATQMLATFMYSTMVYGPTHLYELTSALIGDDHE